VRNWLVMVLISLLVSLVNGGSWRYLNVENGALPDNSIQKIYFDDDGSVWFCTIDTGLIHFENGSYEVINPVEDGNWSSRFFNDIVKSPSGVYWVATEYKGLLRFKNGEWTQFFPTFSDRKFEHLRALALEKGGPENGGDIWIGTWSEGIYRFDGTNFQAYSIQEGVLPSCNVFDIKVEENPDPNKDERVVWIGTSDGLIKYDGESWENFPINGKTGKWVNAIALENGGTLFSNGKMYIGTESGEFIIYDGSNWEIFNISDPWNPNTAVTDIEIDRNGVKWFGTDKQGLGMYDETQLLLYYKSNSGIRGDNVIDLALREFSDSLEVWCSVYDFESGYSGISIYTVSPTGIEDGIVLHPDEIQLLSNFPNPFNPSTTITYMIPGAGHVSLNIYNVMGQRVRALVDGYRDVGIYKVIWDGKNDKGYMVPTGVYFYQLRMGNISRTRKMVLIR